MLNSDKGLPSIILTVRGLSGEMLTTLKPHRIFRFNLYVAGPTVAKYVSR